MASPSPVESEQREKVDGSNPKHGAPSRRRFSKATMPSPIPNIDLWTFLKRYLTRHWPDHILLGLLGGISFYFWRVHSRTRPVFPIHWTADGHPIYPDYLSYPYRTMPVSTWLCGGIAYGVPLLLLAISQFWVRSFWDFDAALSGLFFANAFTLFTSTLLKFVIGGPRPHFFSVCQPAIPPGMLGGGSPPSVSHAGIEICATPFPWRMKDALESFPSGHAAVVFSGAVFVSLYLYRKAEEPRFALHHHGFRVWQLAVMALLMAGALLQACSVVACYHHHWWDAVVGSLIGIVMASVVYHGMFDGPRCRESHAALFGRDPSEGDGSGAVRVEEPLGGGEVGGRLGRDAGAPVGDEVV